MTLSQSIDAVQFKSSNIEIYDENCNQIESESEMVDDKTLKIKPKSEYKDGKSYYLIIKDLMSQDGKSLKNPVWVKFTISSN